MQQLSLTRIILVVLFLFGIYLNIKIPPDSFISPPATLAGLAAFALFFLNLGAIRKKQVLPLLLIALVAFTSIIFSLEPTHYFMDRFKGYILLIYTLFIVYPFFLETSHWSRPQLTKLFLFFVLFIIIGCTLEDYAGFDAVSDAFREVAFTKGLYDGDSRDLFLSGMVRPKLFTSEPSHVGKFFILSLIAWLAFSVYRWKYVLFILFFVMGFLLIRSPMVLMSVPAALLVYFFLERKKNASMRENLAFIFSLGALSVVAITVLVTLTLTILGNRVAQTEAGKEDSFSIRILTPIFITGLTLKKSPLFGAGISGSESIWPEIYAGLKAANVQRVDDFTSFDKFLKNVFFIHWIYYGLLGGLIMLFAMYRFMQAMGVEHSLFCFLLISVFANTMSGPHMPRFWTFFMVVMLISQTIAQENRRKKENEAVIEHIEKTIQNSHA